MEIFCLLGKNGGKLKNLSNNAIIIPAKESARIQEMHIKIIHIAIEIYRIIGINRVKIQRKNFTFL